jgi:lipopolysaccharide transport system ATP-binding protein
MSEAVISVEDLGKCYRIHHQAQPQRYTALRDVIADKVRGAFRWGRQERRARGSAEDFWALRNVSFEVKQGEVVGIIGRNGAGKSTLLKILSRITEPTEGRVRIRGRVASLLEVGTGFHPELTGRENIFLNGAILGMTRAEMLRRFDEIVAFAEAEQFLDTPVKRYSSGMYVRLAFAVAAHLEPEILIVDEVLAVGDAEFQKKCLGKMQEVSRGGRTVLFVSHNMGAVTRLCQKGFVLSHGSISAHGDAASTVAAYLRSDDGGKPTFTSDPARPIGSEIAELVSVSVTGVDSSAGPNFSSETALKVEIVYTVTKPSRGLKVGFHLLGADGTIVFNATDADQGNGKGAGGRPEQPGTFASLCYIPSGFLNSGQYSITVGSVTPVQLNFYCENVVSFFIVPGGGSAARADGRPGLVCPNLNWVIQSAAPQRHSSPQHSQPALA